MKRLIAIVLMVMALGGSAVANMTHYSDGSYSFTSGNMTHYSDGSYSFTN